MPVSKGVEMTRKLLSLTGCMILLVVGCGESREDTAVDSADRTQTTADAVDGFDDSLMEEPDTPSASGAGREEKSGRNADMMADGEAASENEAGDMQIESAEAAPPSMQANALKDGGSGSRSMKAGDTGGDVGFAGGSPSRAQARIPSPRKALPVPELLPGEELWVIEASPQNSPQNVGAAHTRNASPGTGSLVATSKSSRIPHPLPLRHTEVTGQIDGYIASVDVTQQFENPFNEVIEASYVFPLPHSAAINEFVMSVGDRKIRGIVREKKEAQKVYDLAKRKGYTASLMTQERPNIFQQKVANIQPGRQIDVKIRYFNTLKYDDGSFEFVFPMVVSPRFNPSGTDGIGAVGPGQTGASGQSTEIQYASNDRSGRDIALSLNINAGVELETVDSVNHEISVNRNGATGRVVTLSPSDSIPNKDFVLRYQVAGDSIRSGLLTHTDRHGSYFTLMLFPPAELSHVRRAPMEMVFVLDCSGSMNGPDKDGKPLKQAKEAIRFAMNSLTERDTFQIIRFSSDASQLGSAPVSATPENLNRGLEYLDSLNSDGGTQMITGMSAALDFPHDEGRFRVVTFLTDGQIGNEDQVLGLVQRKLGASRIFSFGVGQAPNRYLMDRLAILGRGAATYLSLNDDPIAVMDQFNQRISHPAMTDLHIDWGEMRVGDVYPARLPDLIVGRPILVTGRYRGQPGNVKVGGRVDFETAEFTVNAVDGKQNHRGIAPVWARLKIKDLMNTLPGNSEAQNEIRNNVLEVALDHNLISSVTSFVAVDTMTRTDEQSGRTVDVPSPLPDGGNPSGD